MYNVYVICDTDAMRMTRYLHADQTANADDAGCLCYMFYVTYTIHNFFTEAEKRSILKHHFFLCVCVCVGQGINMLE